MQRRCLNYPDQFWKWEVQLIKLLYHHHGLRGCFLVLCSDSHNFVVYPNNKNECMSQKVTMKETTILPNTYSVVHRYLRHDEAKRLDKNCLLYHMCLNMEGEAAHGHHRFCLLQQPQHSRNCDNHRAEPIIGYYCQIQEISESKIVMTAGKFHLWWGWNGYLLIHSV